MGLTRAMICLDCILLSDGWEDMLDPKRFWIFHVIQV